MFDVERHKDRGCCPIRRRQPSPVRPSLRWSPAIGGGACICKRMEMNDFRQIRHTHLIRLESPPSPSLAQPIQYVNNIVRHEGWMSIIR